MLDGLKAVQGLPHRISADEPAEALSTGNQTLIAQVLERSTDCDPACPVRSRKLGLTWEHSLGSEGSFSDVCADARSNVLIAEGASHWWLASSKLVSRPGLISGHDAGSLAWACPPAVAPAWWHNLYQTCMIQVNPSSVWSCGGCHGCLCRNTNRTRQRGL